MAGRVLAAQIGGQINRVFDFAHQQKRAALSILANCEPFGTTDIFALQGLQNAGFTDRTRHQAETRQSADQRAPSTTRAVHA